MDAAVVIRTSTDDAHPGSGREPVPHLPARHTVRTSHARHAFGVSARSAHARGGQ